MKTRITKISVWEAFKFAVDRTDRFYKEAGRIATEHPQISDNGGPMVGVDPRLPVMASLTAFNVDRPVAVADSKLQALLEEQKQIQQKIEALQINKANMLPEDFNKQIEDLIVQLALKDAADRRAEEEVKTMFKKSFGILTLAVLPLLLINDGAFGTDEHCRCGCACAQR